MSDDITNNAVNVRCQLGDETVLPGFSKEVFSGVAAVVHDSCHVANIAKYANAPYRKAGLVNMLTMDNFVEMVRSRKTGQTSIFVRGSEARAIHNMDGWQDDATVFLLQFTPEWKVWKEMNEVTLGQNSFCDFLEDHLKEIVKPCGAELLEMVSNFRQLTRVEYGSSYRRSDGQIGLEYKERKEGAGGRDMALPSEFVMHLPVVRGAEALTTYEVKARLRVRVDKESHKLMLSYQLVRPDIPEDNAITDIVQHLQQAVGDDVPVFAGHVVRTTLEAISHL